MNERCSPSKRVDPGSSGQKHKAQSLCADIVVRSVACTMLGFENSTLHFEKNAYGKPYLAGQEHFCYSLSHTGDFVVAGISDREIGVDAEGNRPAIPRITKRFFTQGEAEYIGAENGWEERFFQVWTRKEAYIKWRGMGLAIPLRSFDVIEASTERLFHTQKWGNILISCCGEDIETPRLHMISRGEFTERLYRLEKIHN